MSCGSATSTGATLESAVSGLRWSRCRAAELSSSRRRSCRPWLGRRNTALAAARRAQTSEDSSGHCHALDLAVEAAGGVAGDHIDALLGPESRSAAHPLADVDHAGPGHAVQ